MTPDDDARGGSTTATTIVLRPDPTAVSRARSFVQACCLVDGVDLTISEAAVLLTSEVVTNALVHGRSEARLAVTVEAGGVLVEVGDDNSRLPQEVRQDARALDGRGLRIVDVLAQDWGVRGALVGKVVWFRLAAAS